LLAGKIIVELQPVAVRVVEIHSLARRGLLGKGEVVAVVEHALYGLGQLPPIGVEDGYMEQTGVARGRRRPAGAVPGVQPDVVVVAARRQEGRLGTHVHDLEAQDVAVEGHGTFEVGDPQVRVVDVDFRVDGFAHDVLLTLTPHATPVSYLCTCGPRHGASPIQDHISALFTEVPGRGVLRSLKVGSYESCAAEIPMCAASAALRGKSGLR
jgi:hypothetical protein